MSQTHHHHHHHMDDASKFKYRSLRSIEMKKKIAKWLFRSLCCIAIILGIYVAYLYQFYKYL